MLPRKHRLHRASDFGSVVRGGTRKGRNTLVVHVRCNSDEQIDRQEGPRFGLVVSKAVGNAVVRHRVSRRLRHICRSLITELDFDTMVVIRALPPAAGAGSEVLERDLRAVLFPTVQRARELALARPHSANVRY